MSKDDSDDPFAAFAGGGWSAINAPMSDRTVRLDDMTPEQRAAHLARVYDDWAINSAIARCFSTDDGAIVLDWMKTIATQGARFDIAKETDAQLAAAKGFFREGQAAMYFEILNRLRAAEEGPPNIQTEEDDSGE